MYTDQDLESAACSNNSSLILSWITTLNDDAKKTGACRERQEAILLKASLHHSLQVAELVLSTGDSAGIADCTDANGKAPLHLVIEGYNQESEPKVLYNILNFIALLFEHDADPTIQSGEGRTPKEVAAISNFKIGAVFLEILEGIWTNRLSDSALNYDNISSLYQILFEWAIKQQNIKIVQHILSIPMVLSSQEFLSLIRGSEDLSGKTLLHVIATIGNPKLLEILISHCGLPLNAIANKKWQQSYARKIKHIETPLSLAILHDSLSDLIQAFAKHQSKGDYLTHIDLSGTNLASFCQELLSFTHITNLNLSQNRIKEFPQFNFLSEMVPRHLKELNLSHNLFNNLPIELFLLPDLETLNVSSNPLESLPDKWWMSTSLVDIDLSQTMIESLYLLPSNQIEYKRSDSRRLPRAHKLLSRTAVLRENENPMASLYQSDSASALIHLNVSCTCLNDFPECLACFFPNLKRLNISGNKLTSCCTVNELPALLEVLDISNNKLQSNGKCIFSLSPDSNDIVCYNDVNGKQSLSCHHMRHNKLLKLESLNLSNNTDLKTVALHVVDNKSDSVNLFFPKLRKLNLSSCNLQQPPEHLAKLTDLYNLNISNNGMKIPHQICNLKELKVFVYQGLKDPVASDLNKFKTVKEMQMFLRQHNATGVPSVKLMFVGLSGRGKSTLLHHMIYGGKPSGEINPTVGIAAERTWIYSPKASVDPTIAFYPWDFSGDERYSAAHECFIAKSAIYVLCWRASDGEAGILELRQWLLLIKARAVHAAVIVVGTHMDQVDHFQKKKLGLEQSIEDHYYNRKIYPVIRAISFVSCKGKYKSSIIKLCNRLYEIATSLKTQLGGTGFAQQLADVKIPDSYYRLQGEIMAAAFSSKTPILLQEDVNRMGAKYGLDEGEMSVAITYIKEHGMLMHFDTLELKKFYFVNPQWLCNVFTHVVLSPNHFANIDDGKIRKSKLEEYLAQKFKITPEQMEPIFILLQNFELAIPLNINTLLIPSFLQSKVPKKLFSSGQYNFPRRKCSVDFEDNSSLKSRRSDKIQFSGAEIMSVDLRSTGMNFRRLFFAHHIPASIWPKLIARFLLSVKQNSFHKIICDNCIKHVPYKLTSSAGDALIGSLLCKWSYGKNYIELNLGEYVILRVNAFFSKDDNKQMTISATKSMLDNMLVYKQNGQTILSNMLQQEGFEVSIPDYIVISQSENSFKVHRSNLMSMQILSHVLEIIDEVWRDWFEGLSERGVYSDIYLTHIVPCPFCCGDSQINDTGDINIDHHDSIPFKMSENVAFSIQYLLQQARVSSSVSCPHHGELPIRHLAPDVVFDDIAVKKITECDLEMEEHLAQGGFGVVKKMKLLMKPVQNVAVKSFVGGSFMDAEDENSELVQIYADMRMELNKLVSLSHANIVKCIGFCISLLSFVLEWAPFGSMNSVLESYSRSACHLCPESLVHTIKQVSSAIEYLHYKAIVHYDIKPDNILVFHFPQAGHNCFGVGDSLKCIACQVKDGGVLVKLADLGISAFVGPGGFHRKPSTPGHTAPEAIKYGGKEPLGDKVDIFSLGITLYEFMTLQSLPPPGMNYFEFDWDIMSGLRPPLFNADKDPKYPVILKELVFNCWAQDYIARPSAQEIVSILQSPDCLKLSNAYNTELPYSVVSAALVVTVDDQQSLWLAHSNNDQYQVTVYEFAEKATFLATTIKIADSVEAMCQIGTNIWMISMSGKLTAADFATLEIVHCTEVSELANKEIATMLTVDSQSERFVVACKDGLLTFATFHSKLVSGQSQRFLTSIIAKGSSENMDIVSLKLSSPHVYSVEICNIQNKSHVELWCGCDNSVIEILIADKDGFQPRLKAALNTHSCSPDIPSDASIIQLRSSSSAAHMYALHSCGSVISCWSIGDRPVLNTVIKPSQLSSPAATILPLANYLYIATNSGNVFELNLNNAMAESDFSCKVLFGGHQSDMTVQLFALYGRISTNGFLSNIGIAVADDGDKEELLNSMISCNVLLGMGAGYQDLFHTDEPVSSPPLYFTTWTFP